MRRAVRFAIRLYPRSWRDRYGPEFSALLDQLDPNRSNLFDVAKGALFMHLSTWNRVRIAAVFGFVGLLLALAASLIMPKTYVSKAVLRMRSQGGAVDQDRVAPAMHDLVSHVFNRSAVLEMIKTHSLCEDELYRKPMEDIVDGVRHEVRFERAGNSSVFLVSFSGEDRLKAQAVTRDLLTRLISEQNRSSQQLKLEVIDEPNLPSTPISPSRGLFALFGLGTGFLVGLAFGWLRAHAPGPA